MTKLIKPKRNLSIKQSFLYKIFKISRYSKIFYPSNLTFSLNPVIKY